jgi:hypothetical protein
MTTSPQSRPVSETRLSLSHPSAQNETDGDHRRLRDAEIRRSHRLARRAAIIASREESR